MTVNTNEPMHETILIVTDGTSSSDCAVEAGFEIAATSGATGVRYAHNRASGST